MDIRIPLARAIIIGAGIAGIASSIRLARKGYEVDVYEAGPRAGGKLHARSQDGFRFDMGPSLFTMPQLVEELFTLCDEVPEEHFQYVRKEQICHYIWSDGTRFTAPADRNEFIEKACQTFGESRSSLRAYLDDNAKKYKRTKGIFLERSLHRLSTYLRWETVTSFLRMGGMDLGKSLHGLNKQRFKNPKTIQFFDRFATYNGSSPYRSPGIMSMIPHLEMDIGTFYPIGGMERISGSLVELAERQGVRFHLGQPVQRILHEQGRSIGVQLSESQEHAEVIVSNMDVFGTYEQLLSDVPPPKRILNQERSSSALIFYWGIRGGFEEMDLHNILFSDDYEGEFASIFEKKDLHPDPTVYINITAKQEVGHAPEGCENWFVMINAPGRFEQDWDELKAKARERILWKINQCLGKDIRERIMTEMVWTPVEIESDTRSHRGALYGAASNSQLAAFLRHPNFKRGLDGLYFCGGSVHPGGGIPLCLYSARIATDMIPAV